MNPVYNISHPLMQLMLGQLEIEADQMYNFIPFDLRMGQMWTEGALGVVQNMLPSAGGNLENVVPNVTTPTNNTALFQGWWNTYGYMGGRSGEDPSMQESTVIKNYAATNMCVRALLRLSLFRLVASSLILLPTLLSHALSRYSCPGSLTPLLLLFVSCFWVRFLY